MKWSRSEIEMKSNWNQSDIEVKSKWTRSEIQVISKWPTKGTHRIAWTIKGFPRDTQGNLSDPKDEEPSKGHPNGPAKPEKNKNWLVTHPGGLFPFPFWYETLFSTTDSVERRGLAQDLTITMCNTMLFVFCQLRLQWPVRSLQSLQCNGAQRHGIAIKSNHARPFKCKWSVANVACHSGGRCNPTRWSPCLPTVCQQSRGLVVASVSLYACRCPA